MLKVHGPRMAAKLGLVDKQYFFQGFYIRDNERYRFTGYYDVENDNLKIMDCYEPNISLRCQPPASLVAVSEVITMSKCEEVTEILRRDFFKGNVAINTLHDFANTVNHSWTYELWFKNTGTLEEPPVLISLQF